MKCLTVRQPWATLIAIGAKRIETRSWKTNYRGPLAIHAALGWQKWEVGLTFTEPFKTILHGAGYKLFSTLPRGVIIAACNLVDCVPVRDLPKQEPQELAFGDFSAGRFGWMLEDVNELTKRIPVRGSLGLFNVDF